MTALRELVGILTVTAALMLPLVAYLYPDLVAWLIVGTPAALAIGGCIADDVRHHIETRRRA